MTSNKTICEECEDGVRRFLDPITGKYFHAVTGRVRGPHESPTLCASQKVDNKGCADTL